MARPAFRRLDRPEEGGSRLAPLDRDRALVEAAQADPARFDALYRKYVAQVYSYAYYELRDRHEAEDATERTFMAALAGLGRFEERARPAERVDYAWRLAAGRVPTPSEKALALQFLAGAPDDPARVKEFALAVFNLNAFVYVN